MKVRVSDVNSVLVRTDGGYRLMLSGLLDESWMSAGVLEGNPDDLIRVHRTNRKLSFGKDITLRNIWLGVTILSFLP